MTKLEKELDRRADIIITLEKQVKELQEENNKLKNKIVLTVDCNKAEKHGELCLGYGGDEDEPCEQCKNCIKCETGHYQLGETEKDEQLTKAKEIISKFLEYYELKYTVCGFDSEKQKAKAEAFLKE